jgi:hypothetical protein
MQIMQPNYEALLNLLKSFLLRRQRYLVSRRGSLLRDELPVV